MSNAKLAEGPWTADLDGEAMKVRDRNGGCIAIISQTGHGGKFGGLRPPGTAAAHTRLMAASLELQEAAGNAAEEIARVADYLKTALDSGTSIHESKWLDGLMDAHGSLISALESTESERDEN